LAEDGKIIKVHGGALSNSFHKGYSSSAEVYSYHQKQTIAGKAVSLIKDGMFILTGGGTTILELARALPPQLQATFMCGSIPILLEYLNHPNIEVIAIGDKVSKNSKITIGQEAIARIKQIKCDICFLGTNAIDLEHGVSVCLTIAEKLHSIQPLQICSVTDIDILITELPPDDPLLLPYVEAGITVL
jgi:DeoR/GlpR family transcriptional regulator of sugar metabolism